MSEPVICFGQQPCGILPKRFLYAKITKAKELQAEIGGRIVFFYHDSDHDLHETMTVMRDRQTGQLDRLNFQVVNKIQKKYTPLYQKQIAPGWQEETARRLPRFMDDRLVDIFSAISASLVADFCLEMYTEAGLLDGMEVVRSSDPAFRCAACEVEDQFVDVPYSGELVRARCCDQGRLRLHKGGEQYVDLEPCEYLKSQISPSRDTRLLWMQSAVRCTHYVTGAGEMQYLDRSQTPEIDFVPRHTIEESDLAYIPA